MIGPVGLSNSALRNFLRDNIGTSSLVAAATASGIALRDIIGIFERRLAGYP
jgi:hypothetical protein